MFIDGRSVPPATNLETDIAIIGAGAAGITLAHELIGGQRHVTLIESGGFDPDADTQALYEGDAGGVDYPLDAARLRYFGGSTNHWGGFCRPLAEIDFEQRDWVPHSGWPISRRDLDPYYTRAQQVAQLGRQLNVSDFDDTEGWARRHLGSPVPFADALRRQVASIVREDFDQGAIEDVDGWRISRFQAQLCGLACLDASRPKMV